jgi:hypothetical protein
MAATDTFRHFNDSLPKEEVSASIADLIRQSGEELLAARSEDARLRIVESHMKEVHARVKRSEKTGRAG